MVEDDIYCGGCGNILELCNCLCSFCPFGGKCKTCDHVDPLSRPKLDPVCIWLHRLIKSKVKNFYYGLKSKFSWRKCGRCKYFSRRFLFFGFCAWWLNKTKSYDLCYQFERKAHRA